MLEGEDPRNLDMGFCLWQHFCGRVLGMARTIPMMKAKKKYTELSTMLFLPEERMIWAGIAVNKLNEKVKVLKKVVMEVLGCMFNQASIHQSSICWVKFQKT